MKLYHCKMRECPNNTIYQNLIEVHDCTDLRHVVMYDHVCAEYVNGYRKVCNFIGADCSMYDVDNTHSDDPNEWITPDSVHIAFEDVPFYVVYSRNHMKPKGKKAPRPKFHIYFPDKLINDSKEYSALKENVCRYFTQFDSNAKDSARFFFGVENPQIEFYNGNTLLSDFMKALDLNAKPNNIISDDLDIIPEGTRNTTLLSFALRTLKRWGDDSDKAFNMFINESNKCRPLLPKAELDSIWNSACSFYLEEIKTDPDYVQPEEYNSSTLQPKFPLPVVHREELNRIYKSDPRSRKLCIRSVKSILYIFNITVRHNDMSKQIEVSGLPEEYCGEDDVNILVTLIYDATISLYFRNVSSPIIYDFIKVIAHEQRYHPVLEIISAEPWDKIDRIPDIYRMLNISDELDKTLVRKWALQSIAVLYNSNDNPISAQGVLVLQGAQGLGKTEFFRHLAIENRFFKGGATLDMSNKDSLISATKVWICELGEIDSTTRKEQSTLKAFLTEQIDCIRTPYARHESTNYRKTSFCGTVNPKVYLLDETGNRRYWTITVTSIDIEFVFSLSKEWYIQFWRQIHNEYCQKPKSYLLSKKEQELVNSRNLTYETSTRGECEFLDQFDITAKKDLWIWLSAANIADKLNSRYKSLNLRSENVGKHLIPSLEKRLGMEFERKTVRGKRLILCPPIRAEISSNYSEVPKIAISYLSSGDDSEDDSVDF